MSLIKYSPFNNDFTVKVILLGNSGVGKTSMITRLCQDEFTLKHVSTIGVDFKISSHFVNDNFIKLQIWDTAGQERFKAITKSYYNHVVALILVYDVSNENSFESIRNWHNDVMEKVDHKIIKYLVAHKVEDDCVVKVSKEKALELAKELKLIYMEASSKNNIGIDELFDNVASSIYNEIILPGILNSTIDLGLNNVPKNDINLVGDMNNNDDKTNKGGCYC